MKKAKMIFIAIWVGVASSCGKNVLTEYEKKDDTHEAIAAMEKRQPEKAIAILEKKLTSDPENWPIVSLLSAAYAQKYGVDMISFAQTMADKKSSDDSASSSSGATVNKGNGITVLFKVLPEATAENTAGILYALNLMFTIPAASLTTADNFKIALLQASMMAITAKKYDSDGDGNLSPAEMVSLSAEDAATILTSLVQAAAAASQNSAAGANGDKAAAQISSIQEKINAESGETDQEKLASFLGKSG